MATFSSATTNGADRRLVLVDFDWQDADLVPELLQQPGISVRLVAGARGDEAGMRLAELCGLPRTVDLADLTREIFDLALVSERSPRRTQVEGLLLALGTPSVSPQSFLAGDAGLGEMVPGVEAPIELHAAAFESTVGGSDFETLVEQALPDVSLGAPTAPQPVELSGTRPLQVSSLEDFPSPEDRRGLEQALLGLMHHTGAGRAELRVAGPDHEEMVVEVGPADTLLNGLVALAMRLGTPQVVGGLVGEHEGKAWGAWPFRTTQRRGVLAAAGISPATGWTAWEKTLDELRETWDERDRVIAGPAFPMLPGRHPGWLDPQEFRGRLELAVERHKRDGLRFGVHRLHFPDAGTAVEDLCLKLPDHLRDTDCMSHPAPQVVVLLIAGPREAFGHLRRRLLGLWEKCWSESGHPKPAPGITDEHIQIACPDDADVFVATARAWVEGG